MKITEKIVGKLADSVRDDLSKIAEEQTPRLLKALDEQERAGGDSSITLTVAVTLTDKGRAENAVEVQTRYSFTRKVAERDEYIPHIIDLGETLFDNAGKPGKTTRIDIDMEKSCAECGLPGRCENGLCLDCTTKVIQGKRMKSVAGQMLAQKRKEMAGGAS